MKKDFDWLLLLMVSMFFLSGLISGLVYWEGRTDAKAPWEALGAIGTCLATVVALALASLSSRRERRITQIRAVIAAQKLSPKLSLLGLAFDGAKDFMDEVQAGAQENEGQEWKAGYTAKYEAAITRINNSKVAIADNDLLLLSEIPNRLGLKLARVLAIAETFTSLVEVGLFKLMKEGRQLTEAQWTLFNEQKALLEEATTLLDEASEWLRLTNSGHEDFELPFR